MDQTRRPLKIPPEFAMYSEKHGIFEMYKKLMEQLLIEKPTDPLQFLIDELKKENTDVAQVVVLGPPCAGKRTMSKMICGKLRTAHITPDNIIEEADKPLRDEAKKYQESNQAIPVATWVKLIDARLKLYDCVKKGWVMDGFPQTREQALAMQAHGISPKHCVVLDANDTVLIERAAGKRVDPRTGDVYHTTFDWPSSQDVAQRLQEVPGNKEEDIVEKLIYYHRHIDGILDCYKSVLKGVNADQPKADVFSQVATFLGSSPRIAAPSNPRVVLLGPTGSGKAVQATLLANKYNIVNVSCGQLIKQAIADETKTGLSCKPYVEKGLMVPDAIVQKVLSDRLSQLDCVVRGWVLHGYPRTREQAEQLTGAGFVPNREFFLDVPNESVMERLTQRATDPITGARYHLLYNPPRTHDVKDRLEFSPCDGEDAVRKRLSQYNTYAEEISDFYVHAQRINADQDPHTVFECVESMVVQPLPNPVA